MHSEPVSQTPTEARPLGRSLWRGARGRCPQCGAGRLFRAYLKTIHRCDHCGEDMSHHRADDAPPYVTILIVGHLLVPIVLAMQFETRLPDWLMLAIWLPVIGFAALALLQPVKGAIVALQWALRMHGFEPATDTSTTGDPALSARAD